MRNKGSSKSAENHISKKMPLSIGSLVIHRGRRDAESLRVETLSGSAAGSSLVSSNTSMRVGILQLACETSNPVGSL
jgi:hypothetical protein